MAKKKTDDSWTYIVLSVAALALGRTLWKEHKTVEARKRGGAGTTFGNRRW